VRSGRGGGGGGLIEVFDGASGVLIVHFSGDPGARFGAAVASVGDINGDGLADLLVGAPGQKRAYLIDGPFADVAEPFITTTRLQFFVEPPTGVVTTAFGTDVAGIYDLDGDQMPDLRVAALVINEAGEIESRSFVYQSITGALIGIGRRAGTPTVLEAAEGDTDRNLTVDSLDIVKVVDSLGTPSPDGAIDGDVNFDGVVDAADISVVLQNSGTMLYSTIASTPSECTGSSYTVQALEESLCIEIVATSELVAVIMSSVEPVVPGGELLPGGIINTLPGPCADRIIDCLTNNGPAADALDKAAKLLARCSTVGTSVIMGRIYCSPCLEPSLDGVGGFAIPICNDNEVAVNIIICDRAGVNFCAVLAHELVHAAQACQLGLFRGNCSLFWERWRDPRNRICMELEAYNVERNCAVAGDLSPCCVAACDSAAAVWQGRTDLCLACCHELARGECCTGGMVQSECRSTVCGGNLSQ